MRQARALAMAVAVAALAMLLTSGPLTRLGVWSWMTGFKMVKWAFYTGCAGAVLAALVVLASLVPRWRKGIAIPAAAFVIALVAVCVPYVVYKDAIGYANIHDITTDPFDPPAFVALAAERAKAPNGAEYGGPKVAAEQQKAYPDIKSLILKSSPQEAMQKAIDAARSMGWEIASTDSATGRLEATATTTWFGFKDDVIVRIRPEASGGSRVDVRSVSRLGDGDAGANAKRVREFLSKLA